VVHSNKILIGVVKRYGYKYVTAFVEHYAFAVLALFI
jgi:hypothetical protein